MTKSKLVVQKRYTDQAVLNQMRLSFKLAFDRYPRGRGPFFDFEVSPAVFDKLGDIVFPDGKAARLDGMLDRVARNTKLITDFVGDNYKDAVGFAPLYPIVDAYLQIKFPGFGTIFRSDFSTQNAGRIVSGFLGEREFQVNPYAQALKSQKLIGLYDYEDVDTHEASDGSRRILALIASDANDFLTAIDIPDRAVSGPLDRRNTTSDVLAGFCVPATDFSPILLRTACFRFSNVGFLYAAGDLIGRDGQFLQELTYEVLTNNHADFGIAHREKDELVSQALGIYFGPKARRHLEHIEDHERYSAIREKVEKIQIDML